MSRNDARPIIRAGPQLPVCQCRQNCLVCAKYCDKKISTPAWPGFFGAAAARATSISFKDL
jgi:hypothetical protein